MKRKILLFLVGLFGGQFRTATDIENGNIIAWMSSHNCSVGYMGPVNAKKGYACWTIFVHDVPAGSGSCTQFGGKDLFSAFVQASGYSEAIERSEKAIDAAAHDEATAASA